MGRINNKTQDGRVQLQDKLLGSNKDNGATSNYSIESIIPIIFSKGLSNPDVTINITDGTGNVIDDFNASPIVEISVQEFVVVHHSTGAFIFTGGTGIWGVNGGDIADSTMFVGIPYSSAINGVSSINTRTGDVTLDKTDVGLSNVDNTSDADKPVSDDVQTELDKMLPLDGSSNMVGDIVFPRLKGLKTEIGEFATNLSIIFVENALGEIEYRASEHKFYGDFKIDNIKMPKPPTTDGDYKLVVSSGVATWAII